MKTEQSPLSNLTVDNFINFLKESAPYPLSGNSSYYEFDKSSRRAAKELCRNFNVSYRLINAFTSRAYEDFIVTKIHPDKRPKEDREDYIHLLGLGKDTFNKDNNGAILHLYVSPDYNQELSVFTVQLSDLRMRYDSGNTICNFKYKPAFRAGELPSVAMIKTTRGDRDGLDSRFDPNYTLYLANLMQELVQSAQPIRSSRK